MLTSGGAPAGAGEAEAELVAETCRTGHRRHRCHRRVLHAPACIGGAQQASPSAKWLYSIKYCLFLEKVIQVNWVLLEKWKQSNLYRYEYIDTPHFVDPYCLYCTCMYVVQCTVEPRSDSRDWKNREREKPHTPSNETALNLYKWMIKMSYEDLFSRLT